MKKSILLFLSLSLLPLSSYAQIKIIEQAGKGGGRAIEQSTKATEKAIANAQRTVTATTVQTNNAVRSATQAALKTTALPVTAESAPLISDLQLGAKISGKNRSFLEQLKRNQKAKALRQERIARDIRNAEIAAFPKPQLNDQLFEFSFSKVAPKQAVKAEDIPALPFLADEPGHLYRGMALSSSGDELEHIFKNGLLLKNVGNESTTLTMGASYSFVGTHGGAAMMRQGAQKIYNFETSPLAAAEWGLSRVNQSKPVLFLFHMQAENQAKGIVTIARDIKPNEIKDVFALVEIKGQLTWCKVLYSPYAFIPLQDTFRFTLTPYK